MTPHKEYYQILMIKMFFFYFSRIKQNFTQIQCKYLFFHFFTVFFFLQQLLISLQKACKCAIKCNATFHISPKFMHRAAYEPEFQTTVINFLKLYFSFYFIENPCKSNHMFRMPTSLPLEKCSFGFAVPVNWYLFKHGSGSFAC